MIYIYIDSAVKSTVFASFGFCNFFWLLHMSHLKIQIKLILITKITRVNTKGSFEIMISFIKGKSYPNLKK